MTKLIVGCFFGCALTLMIFLTSPYRFDNWEYWTIFLLILGAWTFYFWVRGPAKRIGAGIYGGLLSLGITWASVGAYTFLTWQWWAAFLPMMVVGVIFAHHTANTTPKTSS